jgi:hypothetical protein
MTPASVWAIRIAIRVLPAGAVRNRYEREFLSELHGLSSAQQFRYGLNTLRSSWRLRRAVGASSAAPLGEMTANVRTKSIPILCRLHLNHRWITQAADDGALYRRCRRCGKDHNGYYGHGWGPSTGSFG